MLSSFGPKTLTPTGVRMPVDSMSMRALIGIVQALTTPGNAAPSISAISASGHPGAPLGFGLEIDDRLDHLDRRGIGGRGGRPALPNTDATSGTLLMSCPASAAALPPW